jgi:hypothetical protein
MRTTNTVSEIILDVTGSPGDYPRGCQVTLSNNGITWSSPVATGTGSAVTTLTFASQSARYIRVTQTLSGQTGNWWSIDEFYVFGALPPSAIKLGNAAISQNGSFQFAFTNAPTLGFWVFTTTNISLALSNWTLLGPADEVSPGNFQFSDLQATNSKMRFYRVQSAP